MIERVLVEYVANSIWQVPMVAGVAWLLIWVGKPGVRMQQNVWLMALALCVLLPLLKQGEFTARPATSGLGLHTSEFQPARAPRPADDSVFANNRVVASVDRQPAQTPQPRVLVLRQMAVDWLLGIYVAIVFSRLMQLGFAWRVAQRLVAHASQIDMSAPEQADLKKFCDGFNVPEPRVLVSPRITSPMSVGFLRPVLLLPEGFDENTESERAAILGHELAHINRRDYLANWICQLGSLPIAYHPATHVLHRRIRRTRELVCDRMAADAMRSATGYARCLVTLAQRMLEEGCMEQRVQAPGLFDHDALEERIMQLLKTKSRTSPRMNALRIASVAVLGAAAIVVGISFHVTPTIVHAAETTVPSAMRSVSNAQSTAASDFPQLAPAPQLTVATGQVIPVRAVVPVKVKLSRRAKDNVAMPVAIPVPVTSISPDPLPSHASSRPAHPQANARHSKIPQNGQLGMTPEQRARVEQEIDEANAQIQQAAKRLQSPEFKKQMADMQIQIDEATKKLQSDAMQQQLKMLQSPKFKKQMADMQLQIAAATKRLQSDEARRQMQMVQSPEFQKWMAEMQRKLAEATKRLNDCSMRTDRKDTPQPSTQSNKSDSVPR
ncbi:MAG: M56 family metallopeptidase [Acidobacteriaceae bacterium]